jgi:hypothetical protein
MKSHAFKASGALITHPLPTHAPLFLICTEYPYLPASRVNVKLLYSLHEVFEMRLIPKRVVNE